MGWALLLSSSPPPNSRQFFIWSFGKFQKHPGASEYKTSTCCTDCKFPEIKRHEPCTLLESIIVIAVCHVLAIYHLSEAGSVCKRASYLESFCCAVEVRCRTFSEKSLDHNWRCYSVTVYKMQCQAHATTMILCCAVECPAQQVSLCFCLTSVLDG